MCFCKIAAKNKNLKLEPINTFAAYNLYVI